jgi:hypothetical protein
MQGKIALLFCGRLDNEQKTSKINIFVGVESKKPSEQ